jgi:hypothetical protein
MRPLRVHASLRRYDAAEAGYEADFVIGPIRMNIAAPASELLRAGIQPQPNENFGYVVIEIQGDPHIGRVIFGPEGMQPMIGDLLFDSFCFIVDPVTQTIVGRRPRPLKGIHPLPAR